MHPYGLISDLVEIKKICKDYNIYLIEDAAEACGSFYKKKHSGTFGDVSILSFNGNKIITTGGGGAILTNKASIYKKLKHLATTAKIPHPWDYYHNEIGYNYRLPNINAALGLAQLSKINKYLKIKKKIHKSYFNYFKKSQNFKIIKANKLNHSNYWLNVIYLIKNINLNDLLDNLNKNGIKVRPVWPLLHKMKPYKSFPRSSMNNSEYISKTHFVLPSGIDVINKLKTKSL